MDRQAYCHDNVNQTPRKIYLYDVDFAYFLSMGIQIYQKNCQLSNNEIMSSMNGTLRQGI